MVRWSKMGIGKKKKQEVEQDLLFELPTPEIEVKIDPLTGKPLHKHHEPQRTAHEIWVASLAKPVKQRSTQSWTNYDKPED